MCGERHEQSNEIQEQIEVLRLCLESALDEGKRRHAPLVIWDTAPREAPPLLWTHTGRHGVMGTRASGANGHGRKEGD